MAYIGKTPTVGNFVKLDALTASATASYTMQVDSVNFSPESVNHMLVSLNGVIQSPTTSYTISGATITFASALTSSDSIDFIMVYGNVLDIGTPSDATVTNAKTNFVSTSSSAGLQIKGDGTTDGTLQLNCSQNSHGIKLKSPPHSASASYTLTFPNNDGDADQVLTTNGSGVLTWATASSGGTNTPYFFASVTTNQSITHDVTTKASFDRADVDSASGFDTTNKRYTIPSNQGGYWHIGYSVAMSTNGEYIKSNYIYPYKNGSSFPSYNTRSQGVASRRADSYPFRGSTMTKSFIANYSASDYIEIFVNYGDTRGSGNTASVGEYYSAFWGYRLAQ